MEQELFKRHTREEWLNGAVRLFHPMFRRANAPIPDNVRVSIGFCSTGRKSSRIGECWGSEASSDQHFEIFIRPDHRDAVHVLGTLAHELVHTAVGPRAGHGKLFKRIALDIGLTGKMRFTTEGPELTERL